MESIRVFFLVAHLLNMVIFHLAILVFQESSFIACILGSSKDETSDFYLRHSFRS